MIENNAHVEVEKYDGSINLLKRQQTTPLMHAIFKSDRQMVDILLKKGASPFVKGVISFEYEHKQLNESKYKFLGNFIDNRYMYGSCLVTAVGENKIEIVNLLLELGVSVDEREIGKMGDIRIKYDDNNKLIEGSYKLGWTPLQWAAVKGNNEIIRLLVDSGANVNYIIDEEDEEFTTALILALKHYQIETAKLLIKLGADVNAFSKDCKSPLLLANKIGDKKLLNLMRRKHAKLYWDNEMNSKEYLSLKNDTLITNVFNDEDIKVLSQFIHNMDDFIMGEPCNKSELKSSYSDSLISKIDRKFKNGDDNIISDSMKFSLFEILKENDVIHKIFQLKTREYKRENYDSTRIFRDESIDFTNDYRLLFNKTIKTNNNLSSVDYIQKIAGDLTIIPYPDFCYLKSGFERERLYISSFLLINNFPFYVSEFWIEVRKLDHSVNDRYNKYKNHIFN